MALNRDKYEAEMAGKVGRAMSSQKKRLLVLLGDPPEGNIPASFWEDVAKELSVISGIAINVYMDAAEALVEEVGIGVDWGLINEGAVQWAQQYVYELVKGITETSRKATQAAVSNYFQSGQTMGELTDVLARIYGPVRAEAIAVTEVTRAATQGELAIDAALKEIGVQMVPVWQTNNDELVCPICGPRHNKEIKDDFYPPAHPRCRCWVTHRLPRGKR